MVQDGRLDRKARIQRAVQYDDVVHEGFEIHHHRVVRWAVAVGVQRGQVRKHGVQRMRVLGRGLGLVFDQLKGLNARAVLLDLGEVLLQGV